MADWLERWQK